MEQDEGVIEEVAQLLSYILQFYKKIFGHAYESSIFMNVQEAPQISSRDDIKLVEPFSMEELQFIVF